MALNEVDRVYEELLLTLAQAGDRRAGDRLAARWQPRLYRTALYMLGEEDAAREAVQETWEGVLRGWLRLLDPSKFPAWTFAILRRKCVDRIRKKQRDRSMTAPLEAAEPTTPAAGEDRAALSQALERLGAEHRFAALFYFAEGLTLRETAEAIGAPIGTAKSRIFHARKHLQQSLKGDE